MHLRLRLVVVNKPPPLKRFKLLAQDTRNKMTAARGTATGVYAELDRYMQEVTDVATDNGLLFRQEREHSYPLLAPLAEDFVSAPASQAYVESLFSLRRLVLS